MMRVSSVEERLILSQDVLGSNPRPASIQGRRGKVIARFWKPGSSERYRGP